MKTLSNFPHSPEVEETVLGGILNSNAGLLESMTLLRNPEIFFLETNRVIFKAIYSLFQNNEKVDLITVSDSLKRSNQKEKAGGDVRLISITQKVASAAHLETHIRILLEYYIRRQIFLLCLSINPKAQDESYDSFQLLAEIETGLLQIHENALASTTELAFSDHLRNTIKSIETVANKENGKITGVNTGFAKIDRITSGYQPGNLIVIAARPGMGKTAYALKCVLENIKDGNAVGIISLEMSEKELTERFLAMDTDCTLEQITKTGDVDFSNLQIHKTRMSKYPVFMKTRVVDIRDIIANLRLWKKRDSIKLAVVDYIQLVSDKTKNVREQEVASISRKLKVLAQELQIPIIVLSQLNRKAEGRVDKTPQLQDIRESGAIEQDADIIQFLYRASYYGDIASEDLLALDCDTEVEFAKYRNGETQSIALKFIGEKVLFVDPSEL